MRLRHATFLLASSILLSAKPPAYEALLAGRRIALSGSNFAGFQFNSEGTSLLFAESTRDSPVCNARYRWLTSNLIFVVENGRSSENCSPRTWLLRVESFEGNNLRVREFDNHWPSGKDFVSSYALLPISRNIK